MILLQKEDDEVFFICPNCNKRKIKVTKGDLGLIIECDVCETKHDLADKKYEQQFDSLCK